MINRRGEGDGGLARHGLEVIHDERSGRGGSRAEGEI